MTRKFNILIVAQNGRLAFEAALFAASLRRFDPAFSGRLIVAEPQPGPLWKDDPRIGEDGVYGVLDRLGAELVSLDSQVFGSDYPYGNKIEALALLPDEPFVFFDTDTLITGPVSDIPFDFTKPSASLRATGSWPKPDLYGPTLDEIWAALYARFGLDFASSLDLNEPKDHWRRYLYFNAGWFFHSSPKTFGEKFMRFARSVRDDPLPELIGQSLDPWLDQIVLPLVIHDLGGGRVSSAHGLLDGSHACHYRALPLAYARENDAVITALAEVAAPNWLKKVLKTYPPFHQMIYRGRGEKVRELFDRANLPKREADLRRQIRNAGLWMR